MRILRSSLLAAACLSCLCLPVLAQEDDEGKYPKNAEHKMTIGPYDLTVNIMEGKGTNQVYVIHADILNGMTATGTDFESALANFGNLLGAMEDPQGANKLFADMGQPDRADGTVARIDEDEDYYTLMLTNFGSLKFKVPKWMFSEDGAFSDDQDVTFGFLPTDIDGENLVVDLYPQDAEAGD